MEAYAYYNVRSEECSFHFHYEKENLVMSTVPGTNLVEVYSLKEQEQKDQQLRDEKRSKSCIRSSTEQQNDSVAVSPQRSSGNNVFFEPLLNIQTAA